MRRYLLLGIALASVASLAACGNLFAPQGCTRQIFVTDSTKSIGDSTWRVDTLQRFKLCVQ